MTYEVVRVDDLHPDPVNPRERIESRAVALRLSLLKFGHLMPIVADTEGTICSGHQRLQSLIELGADVAPVLRVPVPRDLIHRGARLMLFNLASADIGDRVRHDPSADQAAFDSVVERLEGRPTIDLNDPEQWPCMRATEQPVARLAAANDDLALGADSKVDGTITLARSPYNVRLPILATAEGALVAGRQRLAAAVMSGAEDWPVVVTEADPLIADAMNVIAMGYAATPLEDVARASVWLNPMWRRKVLGRGMIFYVDPKVHTAEFDLAARADEWKAKHGTYVADLGAGHMGESALLNSVGVRSVAFEPFLVPPGEGMPNQEQTRKMMRLFLAEIARGRPFDSVFLSAVLNQVPFEMDRFRVVTLAHALCSPSTTAYVSTLGTHASAWRTFESGRMSSRTLQTDLRVGGFEPHTQVTSLGQGRVMIQKWHSEEELRHLLGQLWSTLVVHKPSDSFFVEASNPRPIRASLVRRMIEHEFDLPWPDGSRMGMVDEAKAAFSQRLGMRL